MFMQKIDVAAAAPAQPRPLALKLAAGLIVTLICAAAMVPWALLVACWAGVAMVATVAGRTVRLAYRSVLYAGEAVVGR